MWRISNTTITYSIIGILMSIFPSAYASTDIPELSCSYNEKFQRCMQANINGNPRSIEDFICLQSRNSSEILDQIILDEKFREIQEEIGEFIVKLEQDKISSLTQFDQNLDDIVNMLSKEGYFYRELRSLCGSGILAERLSCSEGKVSNIASEDMLKVGVGNSNECLSMVESQMNIYRQIAIDIQEKNKSEVHLDTRQEYEQKLRSKYDSLLQIMLDIISFLERLYNGLTHYTPNPL